MWKLSHASRIDERKSEQDIFKEARQLRAKGSADKSAELLRTWLRRGWFSPEGMDKAGKHIAGYLGDSGKKCLEVLLLGQCTTQWVGTCLTAAGWSEGSAVRVTEGQYDNVIQELLVAASSGKHYDCVVLLPWNQRLLAAGSSDAPARLNDELTFWQQAWQLVTSQMSARLIQVGYDWLSPGAMGQHLSGKPGGAIHLVRQMNEGACADALPRSSIFRRSGSGIWHDRP